MKVTKYGHACMILEEQGQRLVIDPGEFTPDLGDATNVVGIVITHVHGDHFDPNNIAKIMASSPDVQVWSTAEVAEKLNTPKVNVVTGGGAASAGPFQMQFFGEQHAVIHPDYPRNQNVGVAVNQSFYYPGDSFVLPEGLQIKTLAVPACAPWLKISESMDFVKTIKPAQCFPTHNGMLSDVGHAISNNWISMICEANSIGFKFLQPGQSAEV